MQLRGRKEPPPFAVDDGLMLAQAGGFQPGRPAMLHYEKCDERYGPKTATNIEQQSGKSFRMLPTTAPILAFVQANDFLRALPFGPRDFQEPAAAFGIEQNGRFNSLAD